MIRKCTANDINQIVDLAFARDNQPEHNCAYCKDFRKAPKKEASFKTKMVTTENEINKMTSMAASSPEQNQYLKQAIQDGNIKLEDCYILEYNDQIVARAIIMNDYYLALYTVEDIEKEHANEFLANVLKRYPKREFTTDLYSDKKNYNTVYSGLLFIKTLSVQSNLKPQLSKFISNRIILNVNIRN